MTRVIQDNRFLPVASLRQYGLSSAILKDGVQFVYQILDGIDEKLLDAGSDRLARLLELANLSAIIGNLFRGGIVRSSGGAFAANSPHTYPDLLGKRVGCPDIEIKVALETNKPKGHLVKPGPHITVRYVLADAEGRYVRGKENRGDVVWIWEVRVGELKNEHFNFSSTEGDSGKTAVINSDGMDALAVVYCDIDRCPLASRGSAYAGLSQRFHYPPSRGS